MLMYFSYFILFAHFFYTTYIAKNKGQNQSVNANKRQFLSSPKTETSSGDYQSSNKTEEHSAEKKGQWKRRRRLPITADVTSAVGFDLVSDETQYKTRVKMFSCGKNDMINQDSFSTIHIFFIHLPVCLLSEWLCTKSFWIQCGTELSYFQEILHLLFVSICMHDHIMHFFFNWWDKIAFESTK